MGDLNFIIQRFFRISAHQFPGKTAEFSQLTKMLRKQVYILRYNKRTGIQKSFGSKKDLATIPHSS